MGAGKRFLIMDRDSKFTDEFREMLDGEGVEPVRLPPRSPNLNPHIERFIRSIKDESLSRMILFGENMLRNAVGQYLTHYHMDAITNRLITGSSSRALRSADLRVTSNVANVSAACFGTTIAKQRSRQFGPKCLPRGWWPAYLAERLGIRLADRSLESHVRPRYPALEATNT